VKILSVLGENTLANENIFLEYLCSRFLFPNCFLFQFINKLFALPASYAAQKIFFYSLLKKIL
jgi:hypothetical protein